MTKFDLVKERLVAVQGFTTDCYNDEVCKKTSIVLHHTAGGSATSSISFWKQAKNKVSTCVVIDRDGTIFQCFGSEKWAFSLGLNTANYKAIERQTIAIELANYGYLRHEKGYYYNAYAGYMDSEKVCKLEHEFKGQQVYELYTDAQIESCKRLIEFWGEKYGIDIKYKGDRIFTLSQDALAGAGGVWTHNSFRADKSDICPQPKMVEMLKSL